MRCTCALAEDVYHRPCDAERDSPIPCRPATLLPIALGVCLLALCGGCGLSPAEQQARVARGFIFYVDGAGGGGPVSSFGRGVGRGLADAGYSGYGTMFRWQTGLGVAFDQLASVEYKRSRARELARQIAAQRAAHPQAPVTIIALSAGTAIATFALEELPPGCSVERAIYLSGSISATYDLTRALDHVSDRLYVFTSDRDNVLLLLLPILGTADRAKEASDVIGVKGVRMPPGISPRTRPQYAKIVHVPWRPEFVALGHDGGHLGTVSAAFVRAVVAPLVLTAPTAYAMQSAGDRPNPDYHRWQGFDVGAIVVMEGRQVADGVATPIRVTTRLAYLSASMAMIDREIISLDPTVPMQVNRRIIIPALTDSADHPALDADSTVCHLGLATITVAGVDMTCRQSSVKATKAFPTWGQNPTINTWTTDALPGHIARIHVRTEVDGRSVTATLEAKRFVTGR